MYVSEQMILKTTCHYKTFRERQHPRPADIIETQRYLEFRKTERYHFE